MKKSNGITLVILVVTIIVLLILAGVSINVAVGENGTIDKAKNTKEEARGVSVEDERDFWKTQRELAEGKDDEPTLDYVLSKLLNDSLITSNEKKVIEETGQITIGGRTIVFVDFVDQENSKSAYTNLENAILLVCKAEENLVEEHKILSKMYNLSMECVTSLSEADREKKEQEFNQLIIELDRITQTITFNDIKLLDGTLSGSGAYDVDVITRKFNIEISDMGSIALEIDSIDLLSEENATIALTNIQNAFEKVSEQMSKLGAIQNEMEYLKSYYKELNEIFDKDNSEDEIKKEAAKCGASHILQMLKRIKELEENATSTYLDDSSRNSLSDEINGLKDAINIIAEDLSFNNQKLLDGSYKNFPDLSCIGLGENGNELNTDISTSEKATISVTECENAINIVLELI